MRVAYNPEDLRRIVLHCAQTGEFLAEPWLLDHPDSPWSEEHVLRERTAFEKGLKSQIRTFQAENEAMEAEARAEAEMAEAREQVDAEEPAAERHAEDPEDAEAAAILEELKGRRSKTDDN